VEQSKETKAEVGDAAIGRSKWRRDFPLPSDYDFVRSGSCLWHVHKSNIYVTEWDKLSLFVNMESDLSKTLSEQGHSSLSPGTYRVIEIVFAIL
jgi:hypothetical protein